MHLSIKFFALRILLPLTFLAVLSCAGEDSSYESPSTEEEKELADQDIASLNFITYSSDASEGGVVYVPVYSQVYERSKERTSKLTTTLSIRNTDLKSDLTISKVYYFNSNGKLIQKYLDEPKRLSPLSSASYVVEEKDFRGGVGASFLVLWESKDNINEPVIEAVMITTTNQQGVSYKSEGRVIDSLNGTSE